MANCQPRWRTHGGLTGGNEFPIRQCVSRSDRLESKSPLVPKNSMTPKIDTATCSSVFSIRATPDNPDHHIWWNRCSWWFHGTVHHPDHTKQRVRRGLKTKNIRIARILRDKILHDKVWKEGAV